MTFFSCRVDVSSAFANRSGLLAALCWTALISCTADGPSAPPALTAPPRSTEPCIGARLLNELGAEHMLVGVSTYDEATAAEPFDLRYMYLSGGFADAPCTSCAECSSFGKTCKNDAGGCAWWGCWQSDKEPPGAYLRSFLEKTEKQGQVPMISYYEIFQASRVEEGQPEVRAMAQTDFAKRFFDDFRFMLQQVGDRIAIIHPEPDFWGYAQHVSTDPHAIPIAVPTANPEDCADQEASMAGFGRCLSAMTRKYAKNAKIGLHASPFATKVDVVQNRSVNLDIEAHARALAAFLYECAPDADLVIIDVTDRDAGYDASRGDDTWWDDTNATLPNFKQAAKWAAALSEAIGKPNLWWQIPVGNSTLPDVPKAWSDNRVEYLFHHWHELAAAHAIGAAFGAAEETQTTPETDGGLLLFLANEYRDGGGYRLCENTTNIQKQP